MTATADTTTTAAEGGGEATISYALSAALSYSLNSIARVLSFTTVLQMALLA